jgi:hypothetical protein
MLLAACSQSAPSSAPAHDASPLPVDSTLSTEDTSNESADADQTDAAQAWGPDPPTTPCDPEAATFPQCPLPPAVCADSRWLVGYGAGPCVAGRCAWPKFDVDCMKVGGTCAAAPSQDAGDEDAQVAFVALNPRAGSGCLIPAPLGPPPPQVACDGDGGVDAALCSPPPSACAADSDWLIYYDNGQCVAGQCAWETRRVYCNYGCDSGGCLSRPTVPAPLALPSTN